MSFLLAHFSRWLRSLGMEAHLSGGSATPPHSFIICKLAVGVLCPIFYLINGEVKQYWP